MPCRWDTRTEDIRDAFTMPLWQGEPLAGKHLIVATEQGMGDTLQFARYLDILLQRNPPGRLTLAASAALAPLFAGYPGIDHILVEAEEVPHADVYCLLMDLPLRFGTVIDNIPAQVPYFHIPPAKAAVWRERVATLAAGRLAVGLAWQGNPKLGHDHHRSFPLDALAPLFALPGIAWINLQKGAGTEQLTAAHPVLDPTGGDDRRDLMDTAALIAALDVVIAPDSMLAHLAGALGRPVWVPLASRGEWRWLTGREDSPWYPTLRLFRQSVPGDWTAVMRRMADRLATLPAAAESEKPATGWEEAEQALLDAWAAGQHEQARRLLPPLLHHAGLPAEVLVRLTELARQLGELDLAVSAGERAVARAPGHKAAHNNLGLALLDRGDAAAAEERFTAALRIDPHYVRALHNLARARIERGLLTDAEQLLWRALAIKPDNPQAWCALGSVARRRYQPTEALRCFARALNQEPAFRRALLNQAGVRVEQGEHAQAEVSLLALADRSPGDADVWAELASLYDRTRQGDRAVAAWARAIERRPLHSETRIAWIDARRKCCDWAGWPEDMAWLGRAVRASLAAGRPPALPPLSSLRYPTTAAEQRAIAGAHARRIAAQAASTPVRTGRFRQQRPLSPAERLRIGFLSHEFRSNVVGHLLRNLPAAFDRNRFELFGFPYNPDDGSAQRRDLVAGCDMVDDLTGLPVADAARRIAGRELHILIDVNAYMQEGRPEIAALRPAPVQVSYLYPGTMGAPWIDHLLTDEVVTPPDHQPHYREKLLFLPPSYLPATARIPIAPACPDRAHYGLPAEGFVFCSFNKEDKIDPGCFAAWMCILGEVPGGVLWMAADPAAQDRLRGAAAAAGIDPARLVFAPHEPDMSVHLARHRHADLFLDSFIHTAHVTAADALWAGLPLLTRLGETFAGRVAASLLTAAGLTGLIADSTEDYCRRAVDLARESSRLTGVRQDWEARRATHPLFDAGVLAERLGLLFERLCGR